MVTKKKSNRKRRRALREANWRKRVRRVAKSMKKTKGPGPRSVKQKLADKGVALQLAAKRSLVCVKRRGAPPKATEGGLVLPSEILLDYFIPCFFFFCFIIPNYKTKANRSQKF